MNKNIVMIMGGAFVIALVVAMLVQAKMGGTRKQAAVASIEVLVAKRHINMGETLKLADVQWSAWPEAGLYKGMALHKDLPQGKDPEAVGKQAKRDLEAGEPVTAQALLGGAGGGPLSAQIAEGMRAVSVPVKAETMVGGFVSPGDYVDVILSYQVSLHGDSAEVASEAVQRFASETLLSNVKVLAIDQDTKESREAKPGKTVTLEVDKRGAQTLAVASNMGDISLALRRFGEKNAPGDDLTPLTTDVTTSKVIKAIYGLSEQSKGSGTVRVYSGGNVSNVPVRGR